MARGIRSIALIAFVFALGGCQSAPPKPGPASSPDSNPAPTPVQTSWLGKHWELDREHKKGMFRMRPHEPMFVAFRYTTDPNQESTPDPNHEVKAAEVEFQLSLKSKLWEDIVDERLDFWFGYTQQSHVQAFQTSGSFRETNYSPEGFLVGRVDVPLGPVNWRMLNAGVVHQSNGQSGDLSRSWNRVYGVFGFEYEDWSLLVRPWSRIQDTERNDDNPTLEDYMGDGDVHLIWRNDGWMASGMIRRKVNFDNNKGAYQFRLFAPVPGSERLKIFFQYFNGYGETLVDFDHRQKTYAIGISFMDWD